MSETNDIIKKYIANHVKNLDVVEGAVITEYYQLTNLHKKLGNSTNHSILSVTETIAKLHGNNNRYPEDVYQTLENDVLSAKDPKKRVKGTRVYKLPISGVVDPVTKKKTKSEGHQLATKKLKRPLTIHKTLREVWLLVLAQLIEDIKAFVESETPQPNNVEEFQIAVCNWLHQSDRETYLFPLIVGIEKRYAKTPIGGWNSSDLISHRNLRTAVEAITFDHVKGISVKNNVIREIWINVLNIFISTNMLRAWFIYPKQKNITINNVQTMAWDAPAKTFYGKDFTAFLQEQNYTELDEIYRVSPLTFSGFENMCGVITDIDSDYDAYKKTNKKPVRAKNVKAKNVKKFTAESKDEDEDKDEDNDDDDNDDGDGDDEDEDEDEDVEKEPIVITKPAAKNVIPNRRRKVKT